jgi:hypothetical protein
VVHQVPWGKVVKLAFGRRPRAVAVAVVTTAAVAVVTTDVVPAPMAVAVVAADLVCFHQEELVQVL